MRVAELHGAMLDYWVAQIERTAGVLVILRDGACFLDGGGKQRLFAPSLDWAHGGEILERESISTVKMYGEWRAGYGFNVGTEYGEPCHELKHEQIGKTPLQAAMRAYVASKFGDEVPDMADAQPGSAG